MASEFNDKVYDSWAESFELGYPSKKFKTYSRQVFLHTFKRLYEPRTCKLPDNYILKVLEPEYNTHIYGHWHKFDLKKPESASGYMSIIIRSTLIGAIDMGRKGYGGLTFIEKVTLDYKHSLRKKKLDTLI